MNLTNGLKNGEYYSNRCLVLANGFYEWQWLDAKGKHKQKYHIAPRDQEVFAFAGIYSHWKNPQTGAALASYSIVTTEANALMGEIHNIKKRMPVILRKEDHRAWLSGREVSSFALPYEVSLGPRRCRQIPGTGSDLFHPPWHLSHNRFIFVINSKLGLWT